MSGATDHLPRLLALVPWLLAHPDTPVGDVAARFGVDETQIRGVAYQWREEGKSWKLPLLARIAKGAFAAKPSTPYGTGTLHDFMHAKVTVVDDSVFVGSFNLSRSGERNAENVLELEDAALANQLADFVDEVRARYPKLQL